MICFRERLEQKYDTLQIVCKICAQNVHIEKMKDHSKLCRRNIELEKELKEFDNKLNDSIFKSFMRSKELHTQSIVDR